MKTIFLDPKYSSIIFFIVIILLLYLCAFAWIGYQMYLMILHINLENFQKAEAKAYNEKRNMGMWSYDYKLSEYKQIFAENLANDGFIEPFAMHTKIHTKIDEQTNSYPPRYQPNVLESKLEVIKDLQIEFPKEPHYSMV